MSDNQPINPFNTLFSSKNEEQQQNATAMTESNDPLDLIARDVFYISAQKVTKKPLVYLEDVGSAVLENDGKFTMTLLAEAIFERLLIDDPIDCITIKSNTGISHITEKRAMNYLFDTYQRLHKSHHQYSTEILTEVEGHIIRNVVTSLLQSELFPNQNLTTQLADLLVVELIEELEPFMSKVIKEVKNEGEEYAAQSILASILAHLQQYAVPSLLQFNHGILKALLVVAKCDPIAAKVLVTTSIPKNKTKGLYYADTLLGSVFSLSCIPGATMYSDNMFSDVYSQPSLLRSRESDAHTALDTVITGMHAVFEAILRSSHENRKILLDWIWGVLESNSDRGRLWSTIHREFDLNSSSVVSDGFALNLEAVILRLCEPFCKISTDNYDIVYQKILTIDPSFCAVKEGPFSRAKLYDQTCLMPNEESEGNTRKHSETFSFITECFFMAHKAIDIGSRVLRDKLVSLNQEMSRVERALNMLRTQGGGNPGSAETLSEILEKTAGKFISYRAALTVPSLIDLSTKLNAATCQWLVQLLLDDTAATDIRTSFAPGKYREIQFPLTGEEDGSTGPAVTMKLVPEFIVENVASFILSARKFHHDILETNWLLYPLLTLIVSLMGSPNRVRNPHIRARLAEVLECMLPYHKGEEEWLLQQGHNLPVMNRFNRDALFRNHPHRLQIGESLIRVFVDIEMTGQSVAFEQKFSYRHPMYTVLDHLWTFDEQKQCFKDLAVLAVNNIESVNPPVFLRFANLLINDAVFLLDEALGQMAQIREKQDDRENGRWNNLTHRERTQNETNLEQMGNLARSYNILGRETIHTLEQLTSEIQSFFCHPTMVDRVAAMLNYFLLQLVGPKSKTLKTHNMKELQFDPGRIVINICKIYVYLGESIEFCAAVSRDGRSYNDRLFPRAENVLPKINGASVIADLQVVARRVAEQAERQTTEDEILSDAPEEFIDPLMFMIMSDPVILPSSRITVDRTTIARQLLNDQIDPFNRSPLSMEQVIPNNELKEQIEAWKAERQNASRE